MRPSRRRVRENRGGPEKRMAPRKSGEETGLANFRGEARPFGKKMWAFEAGCALFESAGQVVRFSAFWVEKGRGEFWAGQTLGGAFCATLRQKRARDLWRGGPEGKKSPRSFGDDFKRVSDRSLQACGKRKGERIRRFPPLLWRLKAEEAARD